MTDFSNATYAQGSRGLRDNNPLNVTPGAVIYQGQIDIDSGGEGIFSSVEYGIRAAADVLFIYYTVHGYTTLTDIISHWAPASDGNDPQSYIATVSQATGWDANTDIPLNGPNFLALMRAMIGVELGDKYAAYVTDQMITDGINLLGKDILTISAATGIGLLIIALIAFFVIKSRRKK